MKKIVGLTGISGAGKTTVAQTFADNGFYVIDCDKVARSVMTVGSPVLKELAAHFGEDILPDGMSLDRKLLGSRAFRDKESTQLLNRITLPYITDEVKRLTWQSDSEWVLLDAPTLFESGIDRICDATVAVTAPVEICVQRITERDKISEESARERLSVQHDNAFFEKNCTYVLNNNGDIGQLIKKAETAIHNIKFNSER